MGTRTSSGAIRVPAAGRRTLVEALSSFWLACFATVKTAVRLWETNASADAEMAPVLETRVPPMPAPETARSACEAAAAETAEPETAPAEATVPDPSGALMATSAATSAGTCPDERTGLMPWNPTA